MKRSVRGLSLIEVLISVVVLSIGVLGVAGLQLKSLQQAQGGLQASQAIALAYAAGDLMRANPDAAHRGRYTLDPLSPPVGAQAGPDCSSTVCSADQLADYDRGNWYGAVTATLPSGTATIECADSPCSARSVHTIRVYWDQSRRGVTGLRCGTPDYDPAVDLACAVVSLQP
jgi:type IV pilus assembly protein PilV